MNFKKLFIIISALSVTAISCDKDEDTTSLPSLGGRMIVSNLPEFVTPGQRCTLTVKGATHPEGKEVGYYWKTFPTKPGNDTTDTYYITFTDTLQTCTIYCYAFAEGYSSNYTSANVTVVDRERSIKGIQYTSAPIYGTSYHYADIGNQTWIVNNIAETTSGQSFRNAAAMSDIFGRYYNYSDAKAVCSSLPGGEWKLPTNKDWDELHTYIKGQIGTGYSTSIASALMGNATFNGILMWEYWSNVGDINNASGFSAIPVGYATFDTCNDNETDYSKASFSGVYEYAAFWADADDENDTPTCRYLFCDQTELFSYQADTLTFGASVRCIKKK